MHSVLAPHEQQVVDVVEEVFGSLVSEGRASMEVSVASERHGALIEIRPTRTGPCPFTIHCEAPGDLDLHIGLYELTTHIWMRRDWRGHVNALENELRAWLTALAAGAYEEKVRLTKRGEIKRGRGTLHLPDGPYRFSYSYLGALWRRASSETTDYSPY